MKTRTISTALAVLAGAGLVGSLAACSQPLATAEVGACLVYSELEADQAEGITEIPTVECTEEHDGQVIGKFDMEDGDFPGADAVTAAADEGCAAAFTEFVGVAPEESTLPIAYINYVYPTEETWNQANDREILCIAQSNEMVTESWEGAGA